MKSIKLSILSAIVVTMSCMDPCIGQVIISSDDMFLEEGLYSKAYSNGSTPVSATQYIGQDGGPNFWDFSIGPEQEVIRYEYLEATTSEDYITFSGSTIVERSINETTGELMAEIFFEPVTGVGRKVFGFVRRSGNDIETLLGLDGAIAFSTPQIDFPAIMKYGDSFSTVLIFDTLQDTIGGIIGSVAQFRVVQTDDVSIDAFGFARLPGIGFVDVIRMNTVTKSDVQIKQDESFVSLGAPTYSRIYRWIAKGKGIVAEMSSEVTADLSGNASAPPVNFEVAGHFFRMFETNKTTSGGCDEADPVMDLKIDFDKANSRIFLTWSKVECASYYRVEYRSALSSDHAWQQVERTTKEFSFDIIPRNNEMRLYRIVSVIE